MTKMDRRTKQRLLASIFIMGTGVFMAMHVADTLKLDNWAPDSIILVRTLIILVVTPVMIVVLYWLIDRLGRSH